MLIHLSDELLVSIATEIGQTESVVQAVQNLAQARSQGDHIISAAHGVIEALLVGKTLSINTRRIFERIHSEQAQFGSLKEKLIVYIEIIQLRGEIVIVRREHVTVIQVPLIRFQRNDIVQPTFLIAENLLDCQLFLKIASWHSKKYSKGILPEKLKAVFCPGGGDTTEKLLNHHSEGQRYLILCITDSDQKIPNGGLGLTATKCKKLKLKSLCQHVTLPARSIENLLCHSQIAAVLNSDKERQQLLPRLERLKDLFGTESWKHLHIKNGIRDIIGPLRPDSEIQYWRTVASKIDSNISTNDGYLFPPISSNLLLWVVEHLEVNDPEDIHPDLQLLEIWKNLSLLIASWTCASEPIRS